METTQGKWYSHAIFHKQFKILSCFLYALTHLSKVFQFTPPSVWLKKLFRSSHFNELLDQTTESKPDVLEDITDGRIWKEFKQSNFFTNR